MAGAERAVPAIFTQRMAFLVAGLGGIYRQAIPRMAPFALQTRVAAFDERWLYYEHTFWLGAAHNSDITARFLLRGQLRVAGAALSPRESLRRCGAELPQRTLTPPADLDAWIAAQSACLALIRTQ